MHDVFHVLMFRRCVADSSHMISVQLLEICPDSTDDEELVTSLDWEEEVVRNKALRWLRFMKESFSRGNYLRDRGSNVRDIQGCFMVTSGWYWTFGCVNFEDEIFFKVGRL